MKITFEANSIKELDEILDRLGSVSKNVICNGAKTISGVKKDTDVGLFIPAVTEVTEVIETPKEEVKEVKEEKPVASAKELRDALIQEARDLGLTFRLSIKTSTLQKRVDDVKAKLDDADAIGGATDFSDEEEQEATSELMNKIHGSKGVLSGNINAEAEESVDEEEEEEEVIETEEEEITEPEESEEPKEPEEPTKGKSIKRSSKKLGFGSPAKRKAGGKLKWGKK